jgi:hypothetical protein
MAAALTGSTVLATPAAAVTAAETSHLLLAAALVVATQVREQAAVGRMQVMA